MRPKEMRMLDNDQIPHPTMPEAKVPCDSPTEMQAAAAEFAIGILRQYADEIVDLKMRLFRYEILFGTLRDEPK